MGITKLYEEMQEPEDYFNGDKANDDHFQSAFVVQQVSGMNITSLEAPSSLTYTIQSTTKHMKSNIDHRQNQMSRAKELPKHSALVSEFCWHER